MMRSMDQVQVTVRQFGLERQPVVVIDHFSGMTSDLHKAALSADFSPAGACYPGFRAPMVPSYLDRRRDLMFAVFRDVFGFTQGVRLESAAYSLVTLTPEQLNAGQRKPHYDDASGNVIAIMHYLLGPESGGTAFYRHNRSGFEAITATRRAAFEASTKQDDKEFGKPPPEYCYGDDERYTLIGEIDARPDRLIAYRGSVLHSGIIPDPRILSEDPAKGRLTINMFIEGR